MYWQDSVNWQNLLQNCTEYNFSMIESYSEVGYSIVYYCECCKAKYRICVIETKIRNTMVCCSPQSLVIPLLPEASIRTSEMWITEG